VRPAFAALFGQGQTFRGGPRTPERPQWPICGRGPSPFLRPRTRPCLFASPSLVLFWTFARRLPGLFLDLRQPSAWPCPDPLPDIQQIGLPSRSVRISGTVFGHFRRLPCRISTQTPAECFFLGYPVEVIALPPRSVSRLRRWRCGSIGPADPAGACRWRLAQGGPR